MECEWGEGHVVICTAGSGLLRWALQLDKGEENSFLSLLGLDLAVEPLWAPDHNGVVTAYVWALLDRHGLSFSSFVYFFMFFRQVINGIERVKQFVEPGGESAPLLQSHYEPQRKVGLSFFFYGVVMGGTKQSALLDFDRA